MESNPTHHTKSMDVQLQTLIVDAFKCLLSRPRHSYLVIIDGLDECHDEATQQSILGFLCKGITVHKLLLRFLIGSRPESHIRTSFDQESFFTITHRVVLDDTFKNPGRDIRKFLQDGFAKIYAENSKLSHVKKPWPNKGVINLLVQRSSGQFIQGGARKKIMHIGSNFFLTTPTRELTNGRVNNFLYKEIIHCSCAPSLSLTIPVWFAGHTNPTVQHPRGNQTR